MLFIGPTLLSGIGQHCKKYMGLFPGSQYIELQNDIPVCERAFIYALPVPHWLDKIPEIKSKIKHVTCMTYVKLKLYTKITVNCLNFLIESPYRVNFVEKCLKNSFQTRTFILYMHTCLIIDRTHFITSEM